MLRTSKRFNIIQLIICVALFLLGIRSLLNFTVPVILLDEFGYWSNAAYLSGLDWSGVASYNAYYSFGYSFIQSAALTIFSNSVFAYRFMIVLNSLMLVGTYLVAYKCVQMLFASWTRYLTTIVSLIAVCGPSVFANTHLAWPETLLSFLCWFSLFCLLKFTNENRTIYIYLFLLTTTFEYFVHQRALGMLLSGIIVFIILFASKKMNLRRFALGLIQVVILIVLFLIVKTRLKSGLYVSIVNEKSDINDYGAVIPYLKDVFTSPQGIYELISSLCGKIFNLLICSAFLWGYGMVCLFRSFWEFIKHRKYSYVETKEYVYIYILLLQLSSVGISTLINSFPHRVDQLVYGRYTEWAMGIVLVIGINELLSKKRSIIITCIVGVLTAVVVYAYYLHSSLDRFFSWVCSFSLYYFYDRLEQSNDYVWLAIKVCLLLTVPLLAMEVEKRKKYIIVYLICFIFLAYKSFECVEGPHYRCEEVMTIHQQMDPTKDIYFEGDQEIVLWYAASMQFLNQDKTIQNVKSIQNKSDGYYLITPAGSISNNVCCDKLLSIYENKQVCVYYSEEESVIQ